MTNLSGHLTVKERNKMKNEGKSKKLSGHLTEQERNKLKNEGQTEKKSPDILQ